MSSMRSSTIGRSPEMPVRSTGPPGRRRARSRRIAGAGPDRHRARGPARRWNRPPRRPGDAEVVQLHLRLGPGERRRARRRWGRGACRAGPAALARERATSVQNGDAHRPPAGDAHAAAEAKTGSSTVPTVFDSGRPSITAIGARTIVRPRPRNRARSVSNCGVADGSRPRPRPGAPPQISGSSGRASARRVASSAPNSGDVLGLHEQLGERRVRGIGRGGASTSSA